MNDSCLSSSWGGCRHSGTIDGHSTVPDPTCALPATMERHYAEAPSLAESHIHLCNPAMHSVKLSFILFFKFKTRKPLLSLSLSLSTEKHLFSTLVSLDTFNTNARLSSIGRDQYTVYGDRWTGGQVGESYHLHHQVLHYELKLLTLSHSLCNSAAVGMWKCACGCE